jgi:uncharacterized Ntn-hydrolase superfamily protein
MTYTILAVDRKSSEVGIGITTGSINVGGLAPFFSIHGDVATSQAYARRELGAVMMRTLNEGGNAADALAAARADDGSNFKYRQLAVIRRSGELAYHTGTGCRDWAGHVVGDGWIVMGNSLAGADVLDTMAETFCESAGSVLWDRLLRALEAGRDAGGQSMADGRHTRERSAAIRVLADNLLPCFDLRIDLHPTAVEETRRLSKIVTAIETYNQLRGEHPPDTPAILDWESAHLNDLRVPSVLS